MPTWKHLPAGELPTQTQYRHPVRLLRETLPHLALGALTASPWLAAPGWLPLLAVPQAVVWGAARELAQASADARFKLVPKPVRFADSLLPPDEASSSWKTSFTAYVRLDKVAWPRGWWRSPSRWADIGEIAAGAALTAGVAMCM